MIIENVKALTELLSNSPLSAIEVGEGKSKIRVERQLTSSNVVESAIPTITNVETAALVQPVTSQPADAPIAVKEDSVDFNNLAEVRSPLVGIYYSASSPDSEPFVSIGKKIKAGDIICIIETMKLMNEVVAEQDGEIVDILMKNGDIAEFGQVLFKLNATV